MLRRARLRLPRVAHLEHLWPPTQAWSAMHRVRVDGLVSERERERRERARATEREGGRKGAEGGGRGTGDHVEVRRQELLDVSDQRSNARVDVMHCTQHTHTHAHTHCEVSLETHTQHSIWNLQLRVQGSGFRVQGSGFRVQGSRLRVRVLS
eukprot:1473673-Rhodomonas_salina.2